MISVERIKQVDWGDAFLHALGGAGLAVVALPFGFTPLEASLPILAIGAAREWVQAFKLGRELNPLEWSIDKWVESLAWPVGALALAGIIWLYELIALVAV